MPRHSEIPDLLARKICRALDIPEPQRSATPHLRAVLDTSSLYAALRSGWVRGLKFSNGFGTASDGRL